MFHPLLKCFDVKFLIVNFASVCNSNIFYDVKIEEKQQIFAQATKIINKKDFVKGSNFDHDD